MRLMPINPCECPSELCTTEHDLLPASSRDLIGTEDGQRAGAPRLPSSRHDLVEYALACSLISLSVVMVLGNLATQVSHFFLDIGVSLTGVI